MVPSFDHKNCTDTQKNSYISTIYGVKQFSGQKQHQKDKKASSFGDQAHIQSHKENPFLSSQWAYSLEGIEGGEPLSISGSHKIEKPRLRQNPVRLAKTKICSTT